MLLTSRIPARIESMHRTNSGNVLNDSLEMFRYALTETEEKSKVQKPLTNKQCWILRVEILYDTGRVDHASSIVNTRRNRKFRFACQSFTTRKKCQMLKATTYRVTRSSTTWAILLELNRIRGLIWRQSSGNSQLCIPLITESFGLTIDSVFPRFSSYPTALESSADFFTSFPIAYAASTLRKWESTPYESQFRG